MLLVFCWAPDLSHEPLKFWGQHWLMFSVAEIPFFVSFDEL